MGSCTSGRKGGSGGSVNTVLGKKGRAKTPDEALANTNPNYKNGREYRVNCQRCVYAYELQRQGYDVEALPAILPDKNDPMFANSNWEHGFIGQRWEGNLGKRNTDVEQNIVSKMQQWGDGSRAIGYVAWKGGNAHVFNIENHGGKVTIFDAQDGKRYKLSDYLSKSKPSLTEISRVDNLQPNDNVLKYAVKQRRKT